MKSMIFGEKSLSKVGAAFGDEEHAQSAAAEVSKQAGIASERIRVVRPEDAGFGRKLEPESSGIARTLAKSHLTLGLTGLVLGLLIAAVLVQTDVGLFKWNPFFTVGLLGAFGAVAGLLLGGLVSLRPDHDRLFVFVRDAMRNGKWSVVVHARDHDEAHRARQVLSGVSDQVVSTL